MNEFSFALISLALLLAVDLTAVAIRAVFLETSQARLLALREQPGSQAVLVQILLHNSLRLRACLNLSLVLARLLLTGIGLWLLSALAWFNPLWGLLFLAIGAFLLFWLEWAVTQNATSSAETSAMKLASFARLWLVLFSWLVAVPLWVSKRVTGVSEPASTVSEQDLKTLLEAAAQEDGALEHDETRMIQSIFQLSETLAREIMIPRIDMLALEADLTVEQAIETLLASGYSRVPVYDDSIDNTLGLLYAKDLLRVWRQGDEIASLRPLLRPAYFIPEAKKVDELLAEMQSRRIHMAIVVDEYGGVAGVVTMEDIVEEIVGEIRDEFDQGEELPYQELEDGQVIFLGRVDLDDFNEVMNSDLIKDDADTLGGYIYSRLGRVPHIGDQVKQGDLTLTVEQVSARRIRKIRAGWLPEATHAGEDKDHVDG